MTTENSIPRPRFHVSASKTEYVSDDFDDLSDALARVGELAKGGFGLVTIRDHNTETDVW